MKQNRFRNTSLPRLLALSVYAFLISQASAADGIEGLPESAKAMEALLLSEEPATTLPPDVEARNAAEAQLRAAMPFSFMSADPTKLAPAIAAAKAAGVKESAILAAEEKLEEAKGKAEAKLRAAMPFSFMSADPDKLEPALAAAKAAGVKQSAIWDAEEKLQEAVAKRDAAEAQLRAAMPFSFMSADPKKLEPALAAAKAAGVKESAILDAEAKLKEAKLQKAKTAPADNVVLLVDMPAVSSRPSEVVAAASELPVVDRVPVVESTPVANSVPAADSDGKPFLGVGFRDPSTSTVTTLYGNSTAALLGISLGDAIVSVNGKPVAGIDSLRSILGELSVGSDVTVVIRRNGSEFSLGPMSLSEKVE